MNIRADNVGQRHQIGLFPGGVVRKGLEPHIDASRTNLKFYDLSLSWNTRLSSGMLPFITRRIVAVAPDTRVSDAEALAAEKRIRHLLVATSHQLVGVLCVCELWDRAGNTFVSEWMRSSVYTIS